MTAPQLLAEIVRRGGVLELAGPDKLHYRLPPPAQPLLPEIRRLKPELLAELAVRQQQPEVPPKSIGGRTWRGCPTHPDLHIACAITGGCSEACDCRLCAGWRAAMGWRQ